MAVARDKRWLEELKENAWLGLGDTFGIQTENIFLKKTQEDIEKPHLHLLNILRQPRYFGWTCRHILNKEVPPFQLAILDELWNRPFPMLVGSRGLGKSFLLGLYSILRAFLNQGEKVVIVGASFRQAKGVFEYAEEIWRTAPILRDIVGSGTRKWPNGPHKDADRWQLRLGESTITSLPLGTGNSIRGQRACVDAGTLVETTEGLIRIEDCHELMSSPSFRLYTGEGDETAQPLHWVKTRPQKAYEITLLGGHSFICSGIHRVWTENGWRLAKDLQEGERLQWESGFSFPERYVEVDGITLDENLGWLLGILVAEGACTSRHTMSVKMVDGECIGRIATAWERLNLGLNVRRYLQEAGVNYRGWNCKACFDVSVTSLGLRETFVKMGMERVKAPFKKIPWAILRSPRNVVVAFLAGLFEGDGSGYLYKDKTRTNNFAITFYSSSRQLVQEVQVLLGKFGIFGAQGFRESKISKRLQYHLRMYGAAALRTYDLLRVEKWRDAYQRAEKGSPRIFQRTSLPVKNVKELDGERCLYDFHVPGPESFMGHGFRQHNTVTIADEFSMIPVDIFETVVAGFAAVSQSPVERMKLAARIDLLKNVGFPLTDEVNKLFGANQTIISGTAYYTFNHFFSYWKKYKEIIESRGDREKLEKIYQGELPDGFSWRDYSIIRFPYELLPGKYMEERTIAKSRTTMHLANFRMEYNAIFPSDTNGFYSRRTIESCVVPGSPPISHPSCGEICFSALVRGIPGRKYVMGIDPASEVDNFAIVILEVWPDHKRIVHCWTTRRSVFKEGLGRDSSKGFYRYIAGKIRELRRKFYPCDLIALDGQGGGVAVLEALGDDASLEPGEKLIYPIVDPDNPLPSDRLAGEHIVSIVQFSRADWVAMANHGMKKDFEDKVLLFPEFDAVSLGIAAEEDGLSGQLYDTLEACMLEIEELKDELSSIVHSQTGVSGRDRWDTPEVKLPGGRKGRQRKDRYSALLMANAEARRLERVAQDVPIDMYGGFARELAKTKNNRPGNPAHQNPPWFRDKVENRDYGAVVPRKR